MKIKLKVTLEELSDIVDALDDAAGDWLDCNELFFKLNEIYDKKVK